MATGKAHVLGHTVELHGLKKDGSEFPLELSISMWTTGEHTFYSGIIRDITERQRAEGEIRRLNEALTQRVVELDASNRELQAFSYSISHNLRTPLRALAGFSGILLEEHTPSLSAEVRHYLQRIQHNAQNMGHMIDDLLTLMSISRQPMHVQTISPARLVAQTLDELRSAQEGRHIAVTIGDLPVCRADPAMLRQVFLNLLSNALKFTRRQEVARIEIGHREAASSGELVYFVKDNGVGFDMRYVHKLFGVFEHLHPLQDYEGTGVGLAIVQRIIQRHGGRVWAEGAVDQGATFCFSIADGLADPAVPALPLSSPAL